MEDSPSGSAASVAQLDQLPQKRKRAAISLETKRNILREHRGGEKVCNLVRKYGLSQPTISTIIRNALKMTENECHASAGHAMEDGRKRIWHGAYKDVEEALYQWFLRARAMNLPTSGPILAEKAKHFAYLLQNTDFQPGGGWIQRFKERHGIIYKAVVGEAGSLDVDARLKWLDETLPYIREAYADRDLYNGDETGLFFQMLPSKTHALKGDPCKGGKQSKLRVTIFLCANMDNSDKCPAFVIGKSMNPRCFRGAARIPVHYRHNKKAWMTRELFREWLSGFDQRMQHEGRKVALVLDNCTAHQTAQKLSHVKIFFLPPNTTAGLQPMDAGVIACFKALYRRRVLSRLALNLDIAVRECRPAPDFKISLLMAVQFIFGAWAEVSSSIVMNCFRKADFAGDTSDAEYRKATADGAITELWSTVRGDDGDAKGLQEFLHADDAVATNEELTDKAIVAAVTGAEDDDSSDDEDEPEPVQVVSLQEASRMIDFLRDFIFAKNLSLGHVQHLNALQKDIGKIAAKQSKLADYGFVSAKM
ncbi:tigger transposable element-derived protein 6-like [Dermacentor andersoni]|uniref:tigger transposable element-derived protein 6-like n=1 Tax=Dermacentor andersoni TaxID=34620 RepID=UPI003B3ACC7B